MTHRLGGIGSRGLGALTSLSLAAALGCGAVLIGCGGDDTKGTTTDGGVDATFEGSVADTGPDVAPDVAKDVGADVATMPEGGGAKCSSPTFMPAAGTVAAGTTVVIAAAGLPAGGHIFFTTDGTLPNHTTSPVYTAPVAITKSETIFAIAYAEGACSDSTPTSVVYTLAGSDAGPDAAVDAAPQPTCATPTFAPNPGTYATAQSVTISTTTPNATIFYTTNGTNPTAASTVFATPISAGQTETIRAMCTAPGFGASTVGVGTYTINVPPGTVAPPVPSPAAGTQSNGFNVTMTTSTAGATICYGFNTSHPTCTNGVCGANSQNYGGAGIAINGAVTDAATGQVTVNAIACAAGSANSTEVSQLYTLKAAAPQLIPGPATLTYTGPITASPSVSTATNGSDVQIRYTTGATVPTCQTATLLSGPYPATLPVATTVTYNAIACKPGFLQSDVTTALYTVQLNPPTFTPATPAATNDNTVAVTLGAATNPAGSWICASTAGQAACGAPPAACAVGSFNPLTAGQPSVTINGTTIDALTCAPAGYQSSGHVQSGTYMLQLSPLTLSPAGGSLGTSGSVSVTITKTSPTGIDYTAICSTNDGTAPACSATVDTACAAGHFTAVNTATETADATHTTIRAIGCPGVTGDANHGFLASAPAQGVFSPAGTLTAPSIVQPTTQNNVVNVTFSNPNGVATSICYTTDGTAPSVTAGTCTATGGTNCVSAAAGATAAALANPIVTLNQTTVKAIACDPAQAALNSPPASAIFTLQEANPTITPNSGQVSVGGVITFADTTKGTTFHYSTNGTPITCAAGSGTEVAASMTANLAGEYTATYVIQGNETTITVAACDAAGNFIPAASQATASFTYNLVTPSFFFPSGTYDDLLDGTAGAGPPSKSKFSPARRALPAPRGCALGPRRPAA